MSSDNHLHDSSSQGGSRREFEDIEGLLLKQQEQIEREQALEYGEVLKPPSGTGVARLPDDASTESDLVDDMIQDSQTDMKIKEASMTPPELKSGATPGAIRIQGIDGQEEKEEDILEEDNPLNRSAYFPDDSTIGKPSSLAHHEGPIVKAILIEDDEEDPIGPVVVAEEQTETTMNRRKLYIGLGLLLIVVAVVVGASVAVSTRNKGKGGLTNAFVPTTSPTIPGPLIPTRPPSESVTAGSFLELYRGTYDEGGNGTGLYDFQTYHLATQGNGLLEFLDRTDIALTIFAPAGRAFQNSIITTTFVSKYLSDSWVGHSRSLFLNFIIVSEFALFSDKVKNGSVFTTEAGTQIILKKNGTDLSVVTKNVAVPVEAPVRVPDIAVSNGVIHALFDFYYPPWFNRTVYDVLKTANATRDGDLSILLDLLNASSSLRELVSKRGGNPLTLFAPVNSAFSGLSAGLLDDAITNGLADDSDLYMVLNNHMTSANYVASFRAWKRIPEGTKVGEDQIVLQSGAFHLLAINATNDTTTVNGVAKVLEFDLLSEFGVVQVIDELLTIDGVEL